MDAVLLGFHLRRDRPGLAGAAAVGVEDRGVVEEVDDAAELGFLADRELERRHARPELLLELVERARERRPFPVELVDEERPREPEIARHPPHDLGLHLDALDRRHHEDGQVGGAERGGDVGDEVGVARRVEHVDLDALVLEGGDAERRGDPPPGLLGVEIGDGAAVLHASLAGDRAGDEQQCLGQ